tara:strand:+ start:630 stop:869 length:240 start_codon:yes stop_codon:yes gene_type:complete
MDSKDRLVTLTQAAQILGYKHYASILRLIEEGYLQTYKDQKGRKKRVKIKEVFSLAVPEDQSRVKQLSKIYKDSCKNGF